MVTTKKKRARELLEEDQKPYNEMPLLRVRGKRWEELPARRTSSSVIFSRKDLTERTERKPYSFLHTHPRIEESTIIDDPKKLMDDTDLALYEIDPKMVTDLVKTHEIPLRYAPAFPSDPDVLSLLKDKQQKTSIVAQRDPVTGKVSGYFFMRKTKKTPNFPQYPEDEKESNVEKFYKSPKVKQFEKLTKDWQDLEVNHKNKDYQKEFERVMHKYGIQIRYVPAKGYEFHEGLFRKKQDEKQTSKLEKKLSVAIALICIFGGLFLLTPNLTGKVIYDFSKTTINYIGILLFVIGLICLIFYLKKIFNSTKNKIS